VWCEKLECCGCPTVKKFNDMFSRFDTQHRRVTDGHLATAQSALCVEWGGKISTQNVLKRKNQQKTKAITNDHLVLRVDIFIVIELNRLS